MNETIRMRAKALAEYMLAQRCTVREAAAAFGVSKSTVHKDMCARLKDVDSALWEKVTALMGYHKAVRHLRGGEATRRRYKPLEISKE